MARETNSRELTVHFKGPRTAIGSVVAFELATDTGFTGYFHISACPVPANN
jgi:hypothetical protein